MRRHYPLAERHGLSAQAIAALAIIMEYRFEPERLATWSLFKDMNEAGFTKMATSMPLEALRRKDFVESHTLPNDFSDGEYMAVSILQPGVDWLLQNQDRFAMRVERTS